MDNTIITPAAKTPQDIIRDIEAGEITLSHSSLLEFRRSPAHFIRYKMREKKTTPAMAFGTMVHCLVLEPDEFNSRFVVAPEKIDRRTNAGKQAWSELMASAEGKEIVKVNDFDHARTIADAIFENRASRRILDMVTETEQYKEWEYGGFKWRGIRDGVGNDLVFDLKTTQTADPWVFNYHKIKSMGCHLQGCHYTELCGDGHMDYYIIAVDREGGVSVHRILRTMIEDAHQYIDDLILKFQECTLLEQWRASYEFRSPNKYGEYEHGN